MTRCYADRVPRCSSLLCFSQAIFEVELVETRPYSFAAKTVCEVRRQKRYFPVGQRSIPIQLVWVGCDCTVVVGANRVSQDHICYGKKFIEIACPQNSIRFYMVNGSLLRHFG